MRLPIKYWKHHKGRRIALFCAIVMSTMAMTTGTFFARSASQTDVENYLDSYGNYDIVVPLIEEEELQGLSEREEIAQCELILNGGTCKTSYSADIPFGAMGSEETQKLFHYGPEKGGRYPSDFGEICGYRSSFEALGVAPVLGSHLKLELYDVDGNYMETKEFTIVGVLNDQNDTYSEPYRSMEHLIGYNATEILDFPQMFIYQGEIQENHTITAIALCDPDMIPWKVKNALKKDGIDAYSNSRFAAYQMVANVGFETENEFNDRAHLSLKDFYASTVMPVFLGIVLMVSFLSIYGVMKEAMSERQKQLGLLRSLGMSKDSVVKILLKEILLFVISGVAAGYALGVLVYALYLRIVNSVSEIYIYSAFGAHPAAKAASLNPYFYPWILGAVFSILAAVIPLVKGIRRTPNEMLFPEKGNKVKSRSVKGEHGKIIGKIVGRNLNKGRDIVLLIFITAWLLVFGIAFMLAKSDNDNYNARTRLDEVDIMGVDYYVRKNLSNMSLGNIQYNRHDEGVSTDDLDSLRESEDIAELFAVMKLPGVKLLYQESSIPKDLKETLAPLEIYNNVDEVFWDFEYKARLAQGYSEEDLLYGLPSVAIEDAFWDSLEQYVVSGELDREGLRNGSKIVIVKYPEGELMNPYTVGDKVTLTDVVISDPVVENFDFSHNDVPKGYEPTFYYDDTDGLRTHSPGYAFGEKILFDVQVCAILYVEDGYLKETLYTESFVDNERHTGKISPGYNILCSMDAVSKWGLPDRCYTDVYVKLGKNADRSRFESLWYVIVGKSGDVTSISQYAGKHNITMKELSNTVMFIAMIALILLTGYFAMLNSYHYAINENMYNFHILRAMGMSRKQLIYSYVKEMFWWPLWAALTSVIPVGIFDLLARYTHYYAIELAHFHYFTAENGKVSAECWQLRFPWYIHLWEQPILLLMLIAFVLTVLVNIFAGVGPMTKMKKISIVEGIRNDDF